MLSVYISIIFINNGKEAWARCREILQPQCTADENIKYAVSVKSIKILTKLNIQFRNQTPNYILKRTEKRESNRHFCINSYSNTIHNLPKNGTLKIPSTNEWMKFL